MKKKPINKQARIEKAGKIQKEIMNGDETLEKAIKSVSSILGLGADTNSLLGVAVSGMSPRLLDRVYERSSLVRMVVDTKVKILLNLDWDIVSKPKIDVDEATITGVKTFFDRPNPDDSYYSFMSKVLRDLFVYDAMAFEIARGGNAIELVPVNGSTIRPNVSKDGSVINYFQSIGDITKPIPFGKDEIVYCHEYPSNQRLTGFSPIETLVTEIITDLYALRFNASWFSDGHLFNKIIAMSDMDDTQIEKLESHFDTRKRKSTKVPIISLPQGSSATMLDLGFNNRDMEFRYLEEWVFKRICAAFQIATNEVLELYQSATRASAEVQSRIADSKGFRPIINLLESEINSKVMPLINPNLSFKIAPQRMTEEQKADLITKKVTAGVPLNVALKEVGREPIILEVIIGGKKINPYDLPKDAVTILAQTDEAKAIAPTSAFQFSKAAEKDDGNGITRRDLASAAKPMNRKKDDKSFSAVLEREVFNPLIKHLKDAIYLMPPPARIEKDMETVLAKRDEYEAWAERVIERAMETSEFRDKFEGVAKGSIAQELQKRGQKVLGRMDIELSKDFWDKMANKYYKERFYDKGVLFNIEKTQREQIGAAVAKQYREGLPLRDWWQYLEKELDGIKEWQAERIARTENFMASVSGMEKTWGEIGISKWDFIAAHGACPLCEAIAKGGAPLQYDGKYRGRAATYEFNGNPYTDEQLVIVGQQTGFGKWLPHPNCEDDWTPNIVSEDERKKIHERALQYQREFLERA